ncbi:MAG: class I mannose-6-phosphate isomerase [Verrucomicrobiales bacterium]|jgi:mannose-6-phosphate isomerase class I|nr:class I mannose-6-phosphate isomerase [Verrucomicrobiales bacterium]
MKQSNYDKLPCVAADGTAWRGWEEIAERLRDAVGGRPLTVAVECYPGVFADELRAALRGKLGEAAWLEAGEAWLSPAEVDRLVAPYLGGDDPLFGYWCPLTMSRFFDADKLQRLRAALTVGGLRVVFGAGASVAAPEADILVFADMPRWEGQLRQRRGEVPNLGVNNSGGKASLQYKRAFFVDWRVADRVKRETMPRWDFVLDTAKPHRPVMVSGADYRAGLARCVTRPFRLAPFFDPGPWGGQWMKEVCDLDRAAPNYAWCFDCVPEENSLLLKFGETVFETPAQNLVFAQPRELLGEAVYGRFGPEFPIRFDFLDTVSGGNLSFQVHPLINYAQEEFGIRYTQDESYYMLDAEPGAVVYLGCKNGTRPDEMLADLAAAQRGEKAFDDEKFAARFSARKHDHFLIPAGTLHCSGAGGMVLEISATPYIFTFKLWDWNRLGLDGQPRPVNLARGAANIQWERDEAYARARLVNQITPVAAGDGWREERTGLHDAEFIETRRHWFTKAVRHHTGGGVNVLNLVAGAAAVVSSPTGAFTPFTVHYAETFIVPAAVGEYVITPAADGELATMKAFVRTKA